MTKSLSELAASTRTELEARAIQPPYKLAQRTIFTSTPDGRDNLFWAHFQSATTGGATEQQLIDTAAFFYTAGMAYHGMRGALDAAEEVLQYLPQISTNCSGTRRNMTTELALKLVRAALAKK